VNKRVKRSATGLSLQALIGARVRELRGEQSQDALAQKAREGGLSWTRGMLAKVERGQRGVTLEEFFLLGIVLAVPLHELIPPGGGRIALGAQAWASRGEVLQELLKGQDPTSLTPFRYRLGVSATGQHPKRVDLLFGYETGLAALDARTEAVRDVAAALREAGYDVSAADVADLSRRLWGRDLLEERERRLAGERASRGERGHVTRALAKELAAGLAKERPK
jgi:hypothetical protein